MTETSTKHDTNHHDDQKRALLRTIWLPCYHVKVRGGYGRHHGDYFHSNV